MSEKSTTQYDEAALGALLGRADEIIFEEQEAQLARTTEFIDTTLAKGGQMLRGGGRALKTHGRRLAATGAFAAVGGGFAAPLISSLSSTAANADVVETVPHDGSVWEMEQDANPTADSPQIYQYTEQAIINNHLDAKGTVDEGQNLEVVTPAATPTPVSAASAPTLAPAETTISMPIYEGDSYDAEAVKIAPVIHESVAAVVANEEAATNQPIDDLRPDTDMEYLAQTSQAAAIEAAVNVAVTPASAVAPAPVVAPATEQVAMTVQPGNTYSEMASEMAGAEHISVDTAAAQIVESQAADDLQLNSKVVANVPAADAAAVEAALTAAPVAAPENPVASTPAAVAAPAPANTVNDTLFEDGDSLTVGMKEGGLAETFAANGFNVLGINGAVGATIPEITQDLVANAEQVKTVGTLVLEEGTNECDVYIAVPACDSTAEVTAQLQTQMTQVHALAPQARVFIVGPNVNGSNIAASVIQAMENLASPDDFTFVNWEALATANPTGLYFDKTGVHQQTVAGYHVMGQIIATAVGKAPVAAPAPTPVPTPAPAPVATPAPVKEAPNAATTDSGIVPLSVFIHELYAAGITQVDGIAGVIGNVWGESGIEKIGLSSFVQPDRLQSTPFGVVTPYASITPAELADPYEGWDEFQETPITKFTTWALAAGLDPNSLKVQIQFMVNQIRNTQLFRDLNNPAISPSSDALEFLEVFEVPKNLSALAPDREDVAEAYESEVAATLAPAAPAPIVPAPTTTTTTVPAPTSLQKVTPGVGSPKPEATTPTNTTTPVSAKPTTTSTTTPSVDTPTTPQPTVPPEDANYPQKDTGGILGTLEQPPLKHAGN
jgi:hypothetical protein